MSGASDEDPSGGLLFLTSALFLGILIRTLKPYLKLPYTVILLVVGVLFGVFRSLGAGKWGASVHSWNHLHPEYLFYMFLPPLIFSSAFEADHLIFTREIKRILLLAGPGMAIAAGLTGLFVRWVFDYEWNWSTCMAFGTMMSATDPVAVVALLKELGASKTLSLFIEGESLFNDGTAMALFIVFRDAMTGDARSVGGAIGFLLQLSFGAAALGAVVGVLVLILLKWMRFDMVAQITLTLTSAFGTFCIAEGSGMHVSGVIALVILGLVVGLFGRPYLEDHHSVQLFWEMMEYLANTIVFILAGEIVYSIGFSEGAITGYDWGMLFVLFAALQVIRAVTVFGVYFPLARFLTDSPSTPHFGLRGAVGLVLALSVGEEESIPLAVRDRFTFFMSGIAILSLLVNGTTTGFLLNALGMTKASQASKEILRKAIENIGKDATESLAKFRFEEFFEGADWKKAEDFIQTMVSGLQQKNLGSSREVTTGKTAALQVEVDKAMEEQQNGSLGGDLTTAMPEEDGGEMPAVKTSQNKELFQAWLEVARHRLVNLVRAEYWHMFERGYIGNATVRSLVEAASIAQQKRHEPLKEWKYVEKTLASSRLNLRLRKLIACGSGIFLSSPLRFQFEASAAFISAHYDVEDRFRSIIADDEVFETVRQECLSQIACAESTLRDIEQTYPEVAGAIKTQSLLKCMIKQAKGAAQSLLHGGELQETDFGAIIDDLQKKEKRLTLPRKLVSDPTTLLRNVGLFHQLSPEILEELVDLASTKEFASGDVILEQDVRAESLFIVLRGTVLFERTFIEGDAKLAAVEEIQEHLRRGQSELSMSYARLPQLLGSGSRLFSSRGGIQASGRRRPLSRQTSSNGIEVDENVQDSIDSMSGEETARAQNTRPNASIPPLKRAPTSFNVFTLLGDGNNARVQSRLKRVDKSFKDSFNSKGGKPPLKPQSSTYRITPLQNVITLDEEDATPQSAEDKMAPVVSAWKDEEKAEEASAIPLTTDGADHPLTAGTVVNLVSGLGRGTLIGLLGMVTSEPMFMRVCAENHVVCLQLKREHIFHLLKSHSDPEKPFREVSPLEVILCRMSGMNVARIFLSKFGKVSNRDIRAVLAHSAVIRPRPYRPFELQGSAILLTGRQLAPQEEMDVEDDSVAALGMDSMPKWAQHCSQVYSPEIKRFVTKLVRTETAKNKQKNNIGSSAIQSPPSTRNKRKSLLSRQKINLEGFDSEYLAADKRDYDPNMESLFETKLWAFGFIELDSTGVYWFGPGTRLIVLPKKVEGVEDNMARILRHDEATTRRRAMQIMVQTGRRNSATQRRRSHVEEQLQKQLVELNQRRSTRRLD